MEGKGEGGGGLISFCWLLRLLMMVSVGRTTNIHTPSIFYPPRQTLMAELAPQSKDGGYVRPSYGFRGSIPTAEFPWEPGRYHM